MQHDRGPGAGLPPARQPPPRPPEPPADRESDRSRLAEIQAAQEDREAAAALHAAELLGEQLLQANRKLELALAETARLHRALTERSAAAAAAEQRATALAERLVECEQALGDARCEQAAAARRIQTLQSEWAASSTAASTAEQALQSQLAEARLDASETIQALQSQLALLHASTSWRMSAPLRLAKTLIGRLKR